jgi:hypothetical protein
MSAASATVPDSATPAHAAVRILTNFIGLSILLRSEPAAMARA